MCVVVCRGEVQRRAAHARSRGQNLSGADLSDLQGMWPAGSGGARAGQESPARHLPQPSLSSTASLGSVLSASAAAAAAAAPSGVVRVRAALP